MPSLGQGGPDKDETAVRSSELHGSVQVPGAGDGGPFGHRGGGPVRARPLPGWPRVAGSARPAAAAPLSIHGSLTSNPGRSGAKAALRAALAMRTQGFNPDAIVAHRGWGGLFLKEAGPQTRLGLYGDFFTTRMARMSDSIRSSVRQRPAMLLGCSSRTSTACCILNRRTPGLH